MPRPPLPQQPPPQFYYQQYQTSAPHQPEEELLIDLSLDTDHEMTPPDDPIPLAPFMPLADPLIPAPMEHEPAPTIMTQPLPLDYYQDATDHGSTLVPGFTPTGVEIAEPTYAGAPMTPKWTEYHSNPTSPNIPERRPSESPPPDEPLPRRVRESLTTYRSVPSSQVNTPATTPPNPGSPSMSQPQTQEAPMDASRLEVLATLCRILSMTSNPPLTRHNTEYLLD